MGQGFPLALVRASKSMEQLQIHRTNHKKFYVRVPTRIHLQICTGEPLAVARHAEGCSAKGNLTKSRLFVTHTKARNLERHTRQANTGLLCGRLQWNIELLAHNGTSCLLQHLLGPGSSLPPPYKLINLLEAGSSGARRRIPLADTRQRLSHLILRDYRPPLLPRHTWQPTGLNPTLTACITVCSGLADGYRLTGVAASLPNSSVLWVPCSVLLHRSFACMVLACTAPTIASSAPPSTSKQHRPRRFLSHGVAACTRAVAGTTQLV